MKMQNFDTFHKSFNFPMPQALVDLFQEKTLPRNEPVGFCFTHVQYTLEVQYWLDSEDPGNYDIEKKRLRFAVNSDGHELLVALSDDRLPILQDEGWDIDFLELTIPDLLVAKRYALSK